MIKRTIKRCIAIMACTCALLITFPVHGNDVQEKLERMQVGLSPFVQECDNVSVGWLNGRSGIYINQLCVFDDGTTYGLIRKNIVVDLDNLKFVRNLGFYPLP